MQNITNAPATLLAEKETRDKSFRKRGILTALFSGFLYGGYTAFMTHGMESGVWNDLYGGTGVAAGITAFALVYTLSALGAAVNDICSGVWSLIYGGAIGRIGDVGRTLKTKTGKILILAAIIGGPIASTCYVIGLQMAGSIIVPIAALNAAIGALYGRIRYKQKLTGGMILGIVICFAAAVLIGSSSMTGLSFSGKAALGMLAAFCAALGWGIEGAVGGYACCIADYEVAIIIRQVTAGFVNGVILVSLLSIIGGDGIGSGFAWLGAALTDGPSIWMFFIAGMFASFSFKFWYKGASMCGAALGMGCNGTYAFWGPLFCFVVIGLIFGVDGYAIPWQGWTGAAVMVVGIIILAVSQDKATREA